MSENNIAELNDNLIKKVDGGISDELFKKKMEDILILDEPTSVLSADEIKSVLELLKKLGRTNTMIIITHEIDKAGEISRKQLMDILGI